MKELTLGVVEGVVEGVGRQARLDRPAFDPELRAGLAIVGGMFPPTVTGDLIDFMRVSYAGPPLETLIGGRSIRCEDRVFEGYEGHPLKASVFRHERASGQRPGVLFVPATRIGTSFCAAAAARPITAPKTSHALRTPTLLI